MRPDLCGGISFLHGGAFVVKASSLTHARVLAAARGIGRVTQFAEGHLISEDQASLIPGDMIGRMLSAAEARRLREVLEPGLRGRNVAEPGRP
jgi:hypothetical protein